MEHSSTEHAAITSATQSRETGEETEQVEDLVSFRGNWVEDDPVVDCHRRSCSNCVWNDNIGSDLYSAT